MRIFHPLSIRIVFSGWFIFLLCRPALSDCAELSKIAHTPKVKTHTLTKNKRYLFAIHDGNLCIKPRKKNKSWQLVEIPSTLRRNIHGISVDGPRLIARTNDNRIFSMRRALKKRSFIWTNRFGVPFGLGRGLTMPFGSTFWDFSFLSAKLDRDYIDSAGQRHFIGFGVSTIFAVGQDKQEIFYFDPWIAADQTNQVCGPLRGTLRIAGFASLGSTLAVMDAFGNIFVRRHDFDIAGGDRAVIGYTYKIRKPRDDFFTWFRGPRKLPVPDWQKLPKIDGTITNNISLERRGHGARIRLVRVEGIHHGATGYFEARFDFLDNSPDLAVKHKKPIVWQFHETGDVLKGQLINNSYDEQVVDRGFSRDRSYVSVENNETMIELTNFNKYCSPATMRVMFAKGDDPIDLLLHHRETLHILRKSINSPLKLRGRIEIPKKLLKQFDKLTNAQKNFLKDRLNKKRFTKVNLKVYLEKVKVKKTGLQNTHSWEFSIR